LRWLPETDTNRARIPLLNPSSKPVSLRLNFARVLVFGACSQTAVGYGADRPGPPFGLTVELLRFPEQAVIGDLVPEFAWIVNDPKRGARQGAYQIQVATRRTHLENNAPDVWDSGKVQSDRSLNVSYGGKALQPGTDYRWRVKTWDGKQVEGAYSIVQTFHTTPAQLPAAAFPGESRWVTLRDDPVLEDRQRPNFEVHKPVVAKTVDRHHHFFDFGQAAFATFRMTVVSPRSGLKLRVFLGERRDGDAVHKNPGTTHVGYAEVELSLQAGEQSITVDLPRHHANMPHSQTLPAHVLEVVPYRFAEIVSDGASVAIFGAEQLALYYPFDDNAARFTSSDKRLNDVWGLCKRTLKATPFLALYSDGNRERMPYEADAFVQQLGHYAVDREYAVGRYTNQFLLWHPSWPTEWKMHAVFMAHLDWMYTANTEHLERNYAHLKARALIELARKDGLISTRTGLVTKAVLDGLNHIPNHPDIMLDNVDWPPGLPADGKRTLPFQGNTPEGERDGYVFADINTVMNAFHYRTLVLMAEIATATGRQSDARDFSRRAALVHGSFNQKLFDRERGVYVDGEGVEHASLHANMFALAFGLVPEMRQKTVVAHIKRRGMACSVYGAQFLLDALYGARESKYALSLMTSDAQRSWLNMLRMGATMTTEAWDETFKPNLTWNHAWGSAPANVVARWIAGVRPLQPGFAHVLIDPQPEGLAHADIVVPTPRGPVQVSWKNDGDAMLLGVSVPPNMSADLKLPGAKPGAVITESGVPLRAGPGLKPKRGGRIVLGGGRFSFRIPQ